MKTGRKNQIKNMSESILEVILVFGLAFSLAGCGYGYYGIDPSSWKKSSNTSAEVQFTVMEEAQKDGFIKLDFEEANGMWKVVSAALPEGF